jgi:hypothetical protein
VTPSALQKRVNGGFTYTDTLPGGIGSATFPKDETQPTGCGELLKTVGAQFKLVAPYVCPPSGATVYSVNSQGKATPAGSG